MPSTELNQEEKNVTELPAELEELVQNPKLLDIFCEEFNEFIPGNDKAKKLVILSCIGAAHDAPIHLALTAEAQKGKTLLLQRLLDFFDNSYFLSASSPKALFYECLENPDRFDKQIIVIDDIDKNTNPEVLNTIKQLTTPKKDNKIIYSTVKNQKNLTIEIKGYFSVIFSTADFPGDVQLKSRFLAVPVFVNKILEKKIINTMLLQGIDQKEGKEKYNIFKEKWKTIFFHVSSYYASVTIPFTPLLDDTPFLENKRILSIYLDLIRNSARLHQFSREKRKGKIIATIKDGMIAFDLLTGLFQYNKPDQKLTENEKLVLENLAIDNEIDAWLLSNQENISLTIESLKSLTVKNLVKKITKSNKDLNVAESTINGVCKNLYDLGIINRHILKNSAAFRYFKVTDQNENDASMLLTSLRSQLRRLKKEPLSSNLIIDDINNNINNILISKNIYTEELFLNIQLSLSELLSDLLRSTNSKDDIITQNILKSPKLNPSDLLSEQKIKSEAKPNTALDELIIQIISDSTSHPLSLTDLLKKGLAKNQDALDSILGRLLHNGDIYEPKPGYFLKT